MGETDGVHVTWDNKINKQNNRPLSTGICVAAEEGGRLKCKVHDFFFFFGKMRVLHPFHLFWKAEAQMGMQMFDHLLSCYCRLSVSVAICMAEKQVLVLLCGCVCGFCARNRQRLSEGLWGYLAVRGGLQSILYQGHDRTGPYSFVLCTPHVWVIPSALYQRREMPSQR